MRVPTANGWNPLADLVMNDYYAELRKFCVPEPSSKYKEWNEFRERYVTYNLRVFRIKPRVSRI